MGINIPIQGHKQSVHQPLPTIGKYQCIAILIRAQDDNTAVKGSSMIFI
jgi:hypothetical protein